MSYQNITGSLSAQDIQEIKAALQKVQQKLPFLVTLSTEERRKLIKMGDKSLAFVSNSVTAAQSNREILPATFDVEELVRDYQLATALTEPSQEGKVVDGSTAMAQIRANLRSRYGVSDEV